MTATLDAGISGLNRLLIGTTLSQFRITAKLGEGGMGEVYRAEDTKLGREVAIKVLPEEVATDAERLARFEREARAVAALSHPNILAIYDFGSQAGVTYAVMELLEGQTLREILHDGPLPSRKALEFARQAANGLSAAHEKGIAHRDLKPDNLMITPKGRVKILDFGLAKWTPPEQGEDDPTLAQTLAAETGPGVVMGTVGYMSPEQVRGQQSDHRSDIFSLGAILYEMLSGQRAFQAESAVETMSAILKQEPPELSKKVEDLPPAVDRVIQHCLEKSPEQRFQSAQDLAFQLEALQQSSISGVRVAQEALPAQKRSFSAALIAAAVAVGMVIGVFSTWWMLRPGETTSISLTQLTFRRGLVWTSRFADEGTSIIYGAAWGGEPVEIFVTSPDSPESRPLDLGSADLLSVSPKGEMAISVGRRFTVGWESQGTLARLPKDGSAPRELLENVQDADWGPDGEQLAVVREVDGQVRLEYPIGTVIHTAEGWISNPKVRPQGDLIAFNRHPLRGDNIGELMIADLEGNLTRLAFSSGGFAWTPDGSELWANANNTIHAYKPDGTSRLVFTGTSYLAVQDIDRKGRVLALTQTNRRELIGLGPDSDEPKNLTWLDWSQARAISQDGRLALFGEGNTGDETGYWLYVRALDGSPAVRIGEGLALAFSPDSRWVLALSNPFNNPVPTLFPTGAGESRDIPLGDIQPQPWAEFLPDGQAFLIAGAQQGGSAQIFHVSLEDGSVRPLTPEGVGFQYEGGAISPDGKHVATIGPSGLIEIYPIGEGSIDYGSSRVVPGTSAGDIPIQWSDDGDYLYVYRQTGLPTAIERIDIAAGERTLWTELSPSDPSGVFGIDMLHMTRDGRSYIFSFRRLLFQLQLIEGLM